MYIKKSFGQSLPILFVFILCIGSYIIYNFSICGDLIKENRKIQAYTYIIIYNILFVLFMFAYIAVSYTDPGSPNKEYEKRSINGLIQGYKEVSTSTLKNTISEECLNRNINNNCSNNDTIVEINDEENNDEINSIDNESAITDNSENANVCKKCLSVKPERTHHCSVCNRCILKMDHHCPWLSNCVGFYNYKFFILFLFYGSLYILFQFGTILQILINQFTLKENILVTNYKKLWLIQLFITFVLGFTICVFFFTHFYQVLLGNETTLEQLDRERIKERNRKSKGIIEEIPKNIYNVGWKNNFIQVFGKNPMLWLIPVQTCIGDGYSFPKNI